MRCQNSKFKILSQLHTLTSSHIPPRRTYTHIQLTAVINKIFYGIYSKSINPLHCGKMSEILHISSSNTLKLILCIKSTAGSCLHIDYCYILSLNIAPLIIRISQSIGSHCRKQGEFT